MRRLASTKSRGIVVYLLIALGMAWAVWAFWATPIQVRLSSSDLLLRLALEPLAALPAGFAPAIAAIVVRKWVTHEGFGDARLRLNLRGKWPYYLFSWLSPLVVALIIALLAAVLGIGQPDFTLEQARTMVPRASQVSLPSLAYVLIVLVEVAVVALLSTPILWGEEFG